MDEATEGATLDARWPVFAFNSGLVGATGRGAELAGLTQPMLVLSGEGDKRTERRVGYGEGVPTCQLKTMADGLNLLPWEGPEATAKVVAAFAGPLIV